MVSLLHPLDRYRTPSCDRDCDWETVSRPISRPRTGMSSQPPRSKPLRGLNCAIVVLKTLLNQRRNKNTIEADSELCPRPRLNSQPQGATKVSLKKKHHCFFFFFSGAPCFFVTRKTKKEGQGGNSPHACSHYSEH